MGDFVPATVSVFHNLLHLACLCMYVCVAGWVGRWVCVAVCVCVWSSKQCMCVSAVTRVCVLSC